MFGYIIPDKPNLYLKDYALYRSVYCGICVSTGKKYGVISRLSTNYDVVFLSALIHNYLGVDYDIKAQKCMLHPFKKRPIAGMDAITEDICAANVMLVYYNLLDDILDGSAGAKKRTARKGLKKAYKKVSKTRPEIENAVRTSYENLRKLESEQCQSIDRLADCFSVMMRDIAKIVLKGRSCEEMESLAYHFGKWIYLIDAIDDLEKDFKRKEFNPYISAFGNYVSREQFLKDNEADIGFTLNAAITEIRNNYEKLKFQFNTDLTDNIVYLGIAQRTKGVLDGSAGGKTPKI